MKRLVERLREARHRRSKCAHCSHYGMVCGGTSAEIKMGVRAGHCPAPKNA